LAALAFLFLLLAGIVAWLCKGTGMDEPREHRNQLDPRQGGSPSGAGAADDRKAKDPRIGALSGEKFPLKTSDFDTFLKNAGHSASAWVAVYLCTGDISLRSEIARFPQDPLACMILAQDASTGPEKLSWAMKLKKLQPENGISSLAMAGALNEMGRKEEARKEWQLALESKQWDGMGSEVTKTLGEHRDALPDKAAISLIRSDVDNRFRTVAMMKAIQAFRELPASADPTQADLQTQLDGAVKLLGHMKDGRGFSQYSDEEEVGYDFTTKQFILYAAALKKAKGTPAFEEIKRLKDAAAAALLPPSGDLPEPSRWSRWSKMTPDQVDQELQTSFERAQTKN
jgi:hypothetical protein